MNSERGHLPGGGAEEHHQMINSHLSEEKFQVKMNEVDTRVKNFKIKSTGPPSENKKKKKKLKV